MLSDAPAQLREGICSPSAAHRPFERFKPRSDRPFGQPLSNTATPAYSAFVRGAEAANIEWVVPQQRLGAKEELLGRLISFWQLDNEAGARLLGYQVDGVQQLADVLNGVAYFKSQDEFDRVAELFEIRRLLHGLYRDPQIENQWLRQPQRVLQNRSPLDVMLDGHFANILKVRQYIETLAGL